MMSTLKNIGRQLQTRAGIVSGLFRFLWKNKMWWMMPMIFVFIVFFAIIIFAGSTPLGPFIYAIF
ncbi:MAG: DUF5989 family protein [Patescibacteria group bacterium]|jgi:hypothetical protein